MTHADKEIIKEIRVLLDKLDESEEVQLKAEGDKPKFQQGRPDSLPGG